MGASRLYVVRVVMQHYARALNALITLPPNWDAVWPTLPPHGQPGEPAFDTLPPMHQHLVTQVFVVILKCLAAYERQIVSGPAPFDRFVAGDTQALSVAQQRGFQHFLRLQCDTCHTTPLFSDGQFHNLGLPPRPVPDRGRADGLSLLAQSAFRARKPDAERSPVTQATAQQIDPELVGQFRTPSLRELAHTAPYGHNGAIGTLIGWLRHYERVLTLPPTRYVGRLSPELKPIQLTLREHQELAQFLRTLSSDYHSEWTQAPEDER